MSRGIRVGSTTIGGPPIDGGDDLDRVLALERRPRIEDGSPEAEELIDTVTSWFALPPNPTCECADLGKPCVTRLRLVQAWALFELGEARGLFGSIGVGFGKSLISLMASLALPGCRLALLLVPPNLASQLARDYRHLSQHFRMPSIRIHGQNPFRCEQPEHEGAAPPLLHVLPYSRLSTADASTFIDTLGPDLIIADEVQNLSDRNSARTRRLLRYFLSAEERGLDVRFACWSGTVTNDSITDYDHLLALALREGSPLPVDPQVAKDWARALDPSPWPAPPGALDELCRGQEHVQEGYYRRLVETPGVVTTVAPSVDVRVEICDYFPEVAASEDPVADLEIGALLPRAVSETMDKVRDTWSRPDDMEVYEDKIAQWRCLHQLAAGFWLRWRFDNGETDEQIELWVARRKCWHKEVREALVGNRPRMDSPLLCARAAARALQGLDDTDDAPAWDSWSYAGWIEVADTVRPNTEAVWISDFFAEDASRWALADPSDPAIIWYESVELGTRVSQISGLPLHDGGPDAGARIDAERGDRSIVASVRSHGTGRDGLQYKFRRQRFLQPFSSAVAWEQAIGRLGRVGQVRDVHTEIAAHTPEFRASIDNAVQRAQYVQRTTGVQQRLLRRGE